MDVVLVMFTDTGERRDFPIKGSKVVIGRDSDSELQIALAEVSRRHCEITVKKRKVAVRDLGSSNGTYVNNKRIQQSMLAAGETLTVGPVIFTVVLDGSPEKIKQVRTIVDAKKAVETEKKPATAKDETGSLDLNDSSELTLEEDSADSSSLAALEEISKQHKGKP